MNAGALFLQWALTAMLFGGLGIHSSSPLAGPSNVSVEGGDAGLEPAPERPLPFFYDLYTFRGEEDRTTVVAAFSVEAGELETERVGQNRLYRYSVTLVLADTVLRTLTNRHDTVSAQLPRRVRGEHLLFTQIEVQTPPSPDIQYRVTMIDATEPGIGQLYWEYTEIPDYSGSDLMVSDIALGQPDAPSGWTRGEATLALLPTDQFPSSNFDVYYEIYNLPEGNPYATEVTIERLAGISEETAEDRKPIQLRFTGESAAGPDGTLPELRRVGTSLEKGRYRITVNIEDLSTGQKVSQSRSFDIKKSGKGATMVPALPVQPRGG